MTELIAGISGFVFRHEVELLSFLSALKLQQCFILTTYLMHMCACVQIKETFLTTYSDAVMKYDGRDDRSLAVDGVQRRVSVFLPVSLFLYALIK